MPTFVQFDFIVLLLALISRWLEHSLREQSVVDLCPCHVITKALKYEPHSEKLGYFACTKTKVQISFAVTAKLISAFVFATRYNFTSS